MDSEQDSTSEELTDLMETESASIGDRLRAAREGKRLELSHISAETRIPIRHLEAIETGNFDTLPSRTYAIGFAKNYARAVGMDVEEAAQEVRAELADGQASATYMAGGMEPGDPAKLPSSGLAWFGAFAAILLAVGAVFFYNTYFGAGATPGSLIADSDEAGEVVADADGAGSAEATVPTGGNVVFTALEDGIWVRFYEDGGERLFEGTMASGDNFELPATASVPRINTGRPDAFSITIGGRSVPKLAEAPVTMGDTPISADALLARADVPATTMPGN